MVDGAKKAGVQCIDYTSRTIKDPATSLFRRHSQEQGVKFRVVELEQAKHGFVLLPRSWVVERSFVWADRFRRLVKDYERLPETLKGLHLLAFPCLLSH